MKSYIFLPMLFVVLCLASCADDDTSAENHDSISRYIVKVSYADANGSTSFGSSGGIIVDNKLSAEFNEGPSDSVHISVRYFYQNERIVKYKAHSDLEMFYYDSEGRLVGFDLTSHTTARRFYRFSYHAGNVVFADLMSDLYGNPEAVRLDRAIVEMDADGNIVKAGLDSDFDGVMTQINEFSYVNNNLVHAQFLNGSQQTYTYSEVRNNFTMLIDNSYGKQVARLRYCFHYASPIFYFVSRHSNNIRTTELAQGTFDVLENGLYRKSVVNDQPLYTTETEFFFNSY